MWDWFINLLTAILEGLANMLGDWGLAIIVLTFIIRLLLTPLTVKSTKSTAKMQVLQPKLQEMQTRYADDPQRLQMEMQKFYSENKFNPLGGCLPVFLQMPVFFALFSVLRDHIPEGAHFYGILDSLSQSASGALASGGVAAAVPFILLDILFGVLTLVPMLLNQQKDSPQAGQMKVMGVVMAVMMMWFGWNVPIGVVLYYDTSAAWGAIQQIFITRRVLDKAKAEEEERMRNQPVVVDVVRKEHKQRPRKKN